MCLRTVKVNCPFCEPMQGAGHEDCIFCKRQGEITLPAAPLKRGQTVEIFADPLSRLIPEGEAVLIQIENWEPNYVANIEEGLYLVKETWLVQYLEAEC